MNLLEETLHDLSLIKKGPEHVLWVGSGDGSLAMSWDDFALIAKDINYDNGYGCNEIVEDLVVVGSNWWLSRWEYDGSEGWQRNTIPVKKAGRPFTKVRLEKGWETSLANLNGEEDE